MIPQVVPQPPGSPGAEVIAVFVERFMRFVDVTDECWRWTGRCSQGYGCFTVAGRVRGAHRVAYQLFAGPIPDGFELDHLCHTRDGDCVGGHSCEHRSCVNPAHLEPVTRRENSLRGNSFAAVNARKTHCDNGHEFTPENTTLRKVRNGPKRRVCRTCNLRSQRKYNRTRRPSLKQTSRTRTAVTAMRGSDSPTNGG